MLSGTKYTGRTIFNNQNDTHHPVCAERAEDLLYTVLNDSIKRSLCKQVQEYLFSTITEGESFVKRSRPSTIHNLSIIIPGT